MAIPIRSPREIEAMRAAGRAARSVLTDVLAACRAGVRTIELDALARERIAAAGAEPLFAGQRSTNSAAVFPGAICVCVNEEAAHGVPGARIIRPGDVVTVDLGLRLDGWCADVARSVAVEPVSERAEMLVRAARELCELGIGLVKPGVSWGDLAGRVRERAAELGMCLVEGVQCHGIGRALHEAPDLPLDGDAERSRASQAVLLPGMVLTIEPIVTPKPREGGVGVAVGGGVVSCEDGFTLLTSDRGWAAQEEQTVAVTRSGARVLTE